MNAYGLLALAVLFVSVGSILVRLAQAPALAVAFYRIGLASLFVLPFTGRGLLAAWPALDGRRKALLLLAGAALGAHFGTWIASLSFTTVAASVLLVNMTPLFTVGLSRMFLGETIAPRTWGALGLALAGAVLIGIGDWSGGPNPLLGDALALLGAVTLSLYHVIGRGLRTALPVGPYVLGVWATAALVLLAACVLLSVPLSGFASRTWLAFTGLALVPTIGGHGLVNVSLRALPAPTVSLFLLGEPVGATFLAYLLLDETPSPWTLAGGAIILMALVLTTLGSSR